MNRIKYNLRDIKPKRTFCFKKNYKRYQSYKKFLAIDFEGRCGYCNDHHKYAGGYRIYHVDHFAPRSIFPLLECEYSNLIYSCPYCNGGKLDDWPSGNSDVCIVNGEGYIDPCNDKYDKMFYRDEQGNIKAVDNDVAKYMHKKLKLSLERHSVIWNIERTEKVIEEIQGKFTKPYPENIRNTLLDFLEKYREYQKYLGEINDK